MRNLWILLPLLVACGGDDGALGENAYLTCADASDCEAPEGQDPECLDKGGDGFCTMTCVVDDDCATAGEEPEDEDDPSWPWVCASFESNAGMHCFPSCEDPEDPDQECPEGFGCRSTGGGADNRKVCFPDALGTTTP